MLSKLFRRSWKESGPDLLPTTTAVHPRSFTYAGYALMRSWYTNMAYEHGIRTWYMMYVWDVYMICINRQPNRRGSRGSWDVFMMYMVYMTYTCDARIWCMMMGSLTTPACCCAECLSQGRRVPAPSEPRCSQSSRAPCLSHASRHSQTAGEPHAPQHPRPTAAPVQPARLSNNCSCGAGCASHEHHCTLCRSLSPCHASCASAMPLTAVSCLVLA